MKFTKSLILLLLIAFSLNLNAQGYSMRELGTPQIRNYSQNDYKAYSQNWGAVQDYRGLMYFANGNGVLEYDGVSWKMIPVTGNMPVYGIAIDNEQVIYVGNAVDFGYLAPNQKSDLEFVSLLENIAPADRDFSIKGKILATNEGVFYKTRNRLFRWNNEKMTCWRLSDTSSCHFVNDHVYVWEVHTGLQILMGDSLRKLREDPFFRDREIISMLPYSSEQTMICTREEGLFLVKNRGLQFPRVNIQPEPFRSPASEFLISNWLLSSIKLKNGYFAFGTLQGGSVVIDAKGDIVQFLNTEIGILNDTHIALAEDSYGALWIAMDNGISRTDISSPVSFWNDDAGLKGSVIKAARLNGELFVATYQGLYHMISPTRKEEEKEIPNSFLFKPVKNMGLQCWDILPVEDTVNPENSRLLIANARGLYVVDNQLNVLLLEAGSYYKVIQSKLSPGRFYAGRDDGVLMFESVDGSAKNFNVIGMVPGLNEKVVSIGEDSDGTIWLGARYKGFIGLRINILTSDKDKRNISDFSFRKAIYDTSAGLPASEEYLLFKYQNRLICITEGGMYRFINTDVHDPLKGNFVHDYSPTNGYPNDYYFVYSLIEDKKGDLWMQLISKELKKKIIVHAVRLGNGFYKYIVAPFRQIPYMDIYTINVEKDGTTWFGGDDGLFRYDTKLIYDYDKSYSVHIRRIVMEGDSVIFRGAFARRDSLNPDRVLLATTQQEDEIPLFASRENSFLFEFAAPVYTDESRNLYRYYLEGFDKDWSDWTSQTSKEYTNLPHGRYVFHIKAKNVYENESDEALFEFSILTPWYMTAWAYILYFLLFGALSYTGVRFSNIRLRKAKARLENIVRERTKEIFAQKREIEKEKDKSDKLLLNILPLQIADELKRDGFARTRFYHSASVMFTDFVGFTRIAEALSPQALIRELDKCFVLMDEICKKYKLEKIKTIGDAYMCAGGIPGVSKTHALDVVLAAIEISTRIKEIAPELKESTGFAWDLRVGINSGELIAGVVGKNKFAYDIWGDAVNTANRMEESGEPGKINISGRTHELVKEFFDCSFRGKIPAKNKGEVDMYFVTGLKSEFTADEAGFAPNELFFQKYREFEAQSTKQV